MWHRTKPVYVERNNWIFGPDEGQPSSMTVMAEDADLFTGLYDADGTPLYRPKRSIGFIRED
jgi:hypothetical protein